jgi:uncharacterized protein (DUF1810 family)
MAPWAGDRFNLERFVAAQKPVMAAVFKELGQGQKRTRWIWFVLPQVDGLGSSTMAKHYAVRSKGEATAYLAHSVLGPRLLECTELVLRVAAKSAHDIFGSPDDLKFRSSMTLFNAISTQTAFHAALDRFYSGIPDEKTLAILAAWNTL